MRRPPPFQFFFCCEIANLLPGHWAELHQHRSPSYPLRHWWAPEMLWPTWGAASESLQLLFWDTQLSTKQFWDSYCSRHNQQTYCPSAPGPKRCWFLLHCNMLQGRYMDVSLAWREIQTIHFLYVHRHNVSPPNTKTCASLVSKPKEGWLLKPRSDLAGSFLCLFLQL